MSDPSCLTAEQAYCNIIKLDLDVSVVQVAALCTNVKGRVEDINIQFTKVHHVFGLLLHAPVCTPGRQADFW